MTTYDRIRQTVFPITSAFIWGTSFVAQSVSTDKVEAFTFNTARSFIAFFVLLAVCAAFRKLRKEPPAQSPAVNPRYWRDLAVGGTLCGVAMSVALFLQQTGLETTSSGKAGFITALYIVLVPVFGLFLRRRVRPAVWVSVSLAVFGLYFLCVREGFSVTKGDFYVFLCAVCFTGHIYVIDHYTQKVDGVDLSCFQLLIAGLVSSLGMLAWETPSWSALWECRWPLLYVGVLSGGVAYTLQILAQKDANPTLVSLLMSLESVFATLAGVLLLHDRMTARESLGCALMLAAVVLAQLPARKKPEAAPAAPEAAELSPEPPAKAAGEG